MALLSNVEKGALVKYTHLCYNNSKLQRKRGILYA